MKLLKKADMVENVSNHVRKTKRKEESDMICNNFFQDFDQIRNNIVYKLVNTDRNKELLEYVPHMEFLDLSILFHCLTEKEKECTGLNLIHNALFIQWDVSLNQLYEAASKNTQRILGYEIKNMRNVMCEIIKKNPGKYDYGECMAVLESSIPMYVLSNRSRTEGAACMLYPELIKDFADALGSSLYIIPSSINELLLVPFLNDDAGAYIKSSIKEVNDMNMKPEDILSYSLYCYDRDSQKIGIY